MGLLDFLKNAQVVDSDTLKKKSGTPGKQLSPLATLIAIRVWADGSVFPSDAAKVKFDLEYRKAVITVKDITPALKEGEPAPEKKTKNEYAFPDGTGNGFDLLDSRVWNQYKGEGAMLFVMAVPKDQPKVDLFGNVNYDEKGDPKVTVMEQGSLTFGQNVLREAIEEVYKLKFHVAERKKDDVVIQEEVPGVDFVDMVIVEELGGFSIVDNFSKPIIFAPKRVVRGEQKGQPDYVRRENLKVFGFIPLAMYQEIEKPVDAITAGPSAPGSDPDAG